MYSSDHEIDWLHIRTLESQNFGAEKFGSYRIFQKIPVSILRN